MALEGGRGRAAGAAAVVGIIGPERNTVVGQPAFQTWAAGGFAHEIIRVHPHDAPGASPGKRPVGDGWQTLTVTPALLKAWERGRWNVGLRTRDFPAVDFDVDDPEIADACERAIVATLGSTARRTRGNSARRVLLYRRSGEPFKKTAVAFTLPSGGSGSVEFLADGQQVVVAGRHHTGAALRWNPPAPVADDLPAITSSQRDEAVAALRRCLADLGCVVAGAPVTERLPARSTGRGDAYKRASAAMLKRDHADAGGRNDAAYKAACYVHDFGVTADEARDLLGRWNEGNRPPLDEDELSAAVAHAYKYARGAAGSKPDRPRAPRPTQADRPPMLAPARRPLSDLGNAELLAERCSRKAIHVEGLGWLWYDGKRWTGAGARAHVLGLAAATVRSRITAAADVDDPAERAALAKWALRSESAERLSAMIRLAETQPGIAVPLDALDRDPHLLNLQNGTVDLRTSVVRPHDPADMLTKVAAASYDPEAPAPAWTRFVSWACCEREDLVAYLQRVAGYCATGLTREQVWFLPHGKGANGKTTFWETLEESLGDYALRAMPDVFLGKAGHPTEIAAFAGSRLVLAIEPEMGKTIRDGLIKAVTGESRMTSRRIGGNPFTFPVTFKIVIAANHRPPTRDTSDGFWRRVALIPFENHVTAAEKDPALKDRLREEWPGILAWVVRGAVAYFEQGLGSAAAVDAATQGYREEQDQLRRFVEDACEIDPNAWAKTGALYQAFRDWAERNGEMTLDRASFVAQLERVDGVKESRRGYGRGHQGIALRSGEGVTE